MVRHKPAPDHNQRKTLNMANGNATGSVKRATVGMDMVPPYNVYVDGAQIAKYENESDAREHFNRLAGRSALDELKTE